MLNSIKYLLTTSILLCFLQTEAQYSDNTFMISFKSGTTQAEIDQALSDLNSEELDMTPITNMRLWKVKSFPHPYPPTGETIIDINDSNERATKRTKTNGGGLNLIPEGYTGNNMPPTPNTPQDHQLNCNGQLVTYLPNSDNPVSVGVFDTGLNYAYSGNPTIPNYYFSLAGYNQWDHIDNDPIAEDPNGHGSHMASIVSHTINKAYGLGQTTIPPQESYEIRRSFDVNGDGYMFEIIDALEEAAINGMNIASCSWSFNANEFEALQSPLYNTLQVLALSYNMLVVAAAGNDGEELDIIPTQGTMKNYPACYDLPNILVATTYDCNGDLATFSNYGNVSVDIALPGLGLAGLEYDNITYKSGTSQSTALLAGIAASLGSHLQTFHYEPIICAIMNSAEQHPNMLGLTKSGGIVDAQAALSILHDCDPTRNGGGFGRGATGNKPSGTVYPNPSNGLMNFNYHSEEDETVILTLTDVEGRLLISKNVDVYPGINTLKLEMDYLDSGFYNLNLVNSKNVESHKIIIRK